MQENNVEQAQCVAPDEATMQCQSDNVTTVNSYGQFKSADSLYEAYRQLEKEFTRKSQQLKEYQRAESEDIVDELIKVNSDLSVYADELRKAITKGSNAGVKLAECLKGRINEPCHIINNSEFLDKYVYHNRDITDKVIEDYLESLQKVEGSATVKGRGYAYVTPSYRPQSLSEASRLAKQYIENRRI